MKGHADQDIYHKLDQLLADWFWRDAPQAKGPKEWIFFLARMAHLSVRNSLRDRVPFSANALTFITLLGLVPALAISFSLAKGLGFANSLRDFLLNNEFLASQKEILVQVIGYVDNTSVGTLGMVGLATLIFTLILTLSNVEDVFNRIWQVRDNRNLLRRFTDYVAVLVICPVLIMASSASWAAFSSHGVIKWLLSVEVVGELAETGLGLGPFIMLVAAFVFMYLFLPNTKVPIWSGLWAGLVAAGLWWLVQSVYINFQVGVTRYNAIYGGFATLPLFMIWLQVSWMVVLFGAELSHAHHVCRKGPWPSAFLPPFSPAQRELLGVRLFFRMARRFHRGDEPLSPRQMARDLNLPLREVNLALEPLAETGLAAPAGPEAIQPGRSLASVRLGDLIKAMRGRIYQEPEQLSPEERELLDILREAECAAGQRLDQVTVQDLLAGVPVPEPAYESCEPEKNSG